MAGSLDGPTRSQYSASASRPEIAPHRPVSRPHQNSNRPASHPRAIRPQRRARHTHPPLAPSPSASAARAFPTDGPREEGMPTPLAHRSPDSQNTRSLASRVEVLTEHMLASQAIASPLHPPTSWISPERVQINGHAIPSKWIGSSPNGGVAAEPICGAATFLSDDRLRSPTRQRAVEHAGWKSVWGGASMLPT